MKLCFLSVYFIGGGFRRSQVRAHARGVMFLRNYLNMRTACYAIFLVMSVASCVTHEDKPDTWAKTLKDCKAIEGKYRVTGTSNDSSYLPNLSFLLLGQASPQNATIQLSTSDNQLTIELLDGSVPSKVGRVDFTCQGGLLIFNPIGEEGFVNREGVAGYENEKIVLGKLSDGALALRKDSITAGIILLIPFAGSSQVWYRFENET